MRGRLRLLFAGAALLIMVSACSSGDGQAPLDSSLDSSLDRYGLANKSAVEVIDQLDRLPVAERPGDLMASVRVDELLISDGSSEAALPIPDDTFYLSVAPYLDSTHDCFYHSLTTCQGELSERDVDVTITTDSGEILVDETVTTFDNGFVGFWLPRDVDATLEISYQGKNAQMPISTGPDDPTCLTTVQLT
jgi:hypothetical protein